MEERKRANQTKTGKLSGSSPEEWTGNSDCGAVSDRGDASLSHKIGDARTPWLRPNNGMELLERKVRDAVRKSASLRFAISPVFRDRFHHKIRRGRFVPSKPQSNDIHN